MDAAVGYMQASGTGHRRYLFGEFVLDVDRGALLLAGADVPLRPKSFEVLNYLVRHAGLLVSKEQLLAEIWHGVVVTDDSLTHCLIDIRKALGDDSREMVKTVRGRGYLFDIPVSTHKSGADPLPHGFLHNNRRSANWGLTFGMSLMVLAVPALWWMLQSNEKAVSDPWLISTGPVSTAADRIPYKDMSPDGNGEISAAGAAHAHYLQGEFFNSRRGPGDEERTIEHFRQAIAIDPELADAWVGLAGALLIPVSENIQSWREVMAEVRGALATALKLDPAHPEAHVMMGWYEYWILGNDDLAQAHYRKAWQYGRNSAQMLARFVGNALVSQNLDEALYLQRQSVALDPLSYVSRSNLAVLLYWSGHFEEAESEFIQARVLNPAGGDRVSRDLALVLIQQQRYTEAKQLLVAIDSDALQIKGLALIYHALDEQSNLQAAVRRLSATPGVESAVFMAEIYAFIGDTDKSLEWLAVASERIFSQDSFQRDWNLMHAAFFSPLFMPMADDSRLLAWRADTTKRLETARSKSARNLVLRG